MPKDEIEIQELEKDITLLEKRYMAKRQDMRRETKADVKVILEDEANELKKELDAKQDKLSQLKQGWESNLHKIDFEQAEDCARQIFNRHFKKTVHAALFLFQESRDYCGQHLEMRLRKEWLPAVNSTIKPLEIAPEENNGGMSFETILKRLWYELGEPNDRDEKLSAQIVIDKLCNSINGGLIFVRLSFWDTLANRPKLLSQLISDFWEPLIDELTKIGRDRAPVKVFLFLCAHNKIAPEALAQSRLCSADPFDKTQIFDVPRELWNPDIIRQWIDNHSGLGLPYDESRQWAEEIFDGSNNGLPIDVEHKLKEKMHSRCRKGP